MFKKIIYFFLITSILACNNQNMTFLSGKIIKPTNNQIQLLKDEKVIKNIKINSDGIFSSSIDNLSSGLYNFVHLPEFQYLIIDKGDSLVLRLNSLDFDESLVFSGKGSSKNNYLIDVFLEHEEEEDYFKSNYKSSKIVFKQIIDSLKNIKIKHYLNYKSSIKTNYISDLIINSAILIPLYSHIENYIILNKLHHSTNIKFFNNYRQEIDLNKYELSHFKPYLDYITLKSINESFSEEKGYNYNLNFNLSRLYYIKNQISNQTIKTKLLRFIAYEYLLEEKLLINIDQFIYEFLKISDNKSTNREISTLYDNIASLQSGKIFPQINLFNEKNINKDISSHVNFNNKNIFVFWSYDQNAHQVNLFNRVNLLSAKHSNYHFNLININDEKIKWKNNYLNKFNNKRIRNFRTVNFEIMSKKMILNNLNKVLVTGMDGVILEILNLNSLEKYLNDN
ncbi:hypothetical protein N9454_04605 [Flavobacteriaceae bacterium]|nr:hypothetical protein [Flavobacteriaceae bacterium]